MKLPATHPKLVEAREAALRFAASIATLERALVRAQVLADADDRERARLVLTPAVEEEAAAFNDLCAVMYSEEMLDVISEGSVT